MLLKNMTQRMMKNIAEYDLKMLLNSITEANLHHQIDFGKLVGKEKQIEKFCIIQEPKVSTHTRKRSI